MLRKLWNDEAGFLVSAELVLIFTLCFCGVAVGVAVIRDALTTELSDVAEAIGALDQSYNYNGLQEASTNGGKNNNHSSCSGSGYNDDADNCDCKGIDLVVVCGKDDPSNTGNNEGS